MAFSAFSNQMASPPGSSVQVGSDLEDIQTEALGFSSIASDAKLQLLPSPWPIDQLPPATASLMSIASRKQLIAAAGPDVVILASTEAVRKGFEQPKSAGSDIRTFQPQSRLPMPMRISQVAFSADENYLVLSAENGGGLAVYETQALLNGSTQSAFELPTNGQSLRALLPNPTPEKADLFAVVTLEGDLLVASLKERSFIPGPNGQVLKTGVSCIAWSVKGKQLVAGLADGTVHQMTPEGVGKGDIPRPPSVTNGAHVSALFWLENTVFLTVHTPEVSATDQAPESIFHIVTKSPTDGLTFQKLIDPAGPFGIQTRATPHHFMLRLKDYPPNLQDLIAVASTASTDIGLFTRSKVPLTNDKPAEKVTGVFTLTEMFDDSRRAQLPVATGLRETSPIGFAFDFSSTEKVLQPIPSDPEISESPTPLPLLTVLNNDGVLSAWWVVYNESIRERSIYPGMTAAPPTQAAQQTPAPKSNAFGSPAPVNPFESVPTTAPAFGAPSAPGAFGAPSGLGQKTSVWGAASPAQTQSSGATFGAPAFGSASSLGNKPAFGSTALPGSQASPWASGAGSSTPAFGQSSFGQSSFGKPSQPSFGNTAANPTTSSSGGFASFASSGGFAAAAQAAPTGGSIFGQKSATSIFGTPAPAPSESSFGTVKKPESNPFGSNTFVLGSTFKADPAAKDDAPPPSSGANNSFFGGAFANSLSGAGKSTAADVPVSDETDMDTGDDSKPEQSEPVSTTPISTPAPPRFASILNSDPAKPGGSSLFGSFTPQSKPSTGLDFGKNFTQTPKQSVFGSPASTTPLFSSQTPATGLSKPILPGAQASLAPQVKSEPKDESSLSNIPEASLPPDTTSKDSYAAGDTSNSSADSNDAPLPPDFMPKKELPKAQNASAIPELPPLRPITADMLPPMDVPGGPSSNEGSSGVLTDDEDGSIEGNSGEDQSEELSEEGSGEDVANDLSPTSDTRQTPAMTPSHSFGRQDTSTSSDFFQVKAPAQTTKLFGEVQRSAPILPPPKITASPRSPSPIRSALPGRMLRPEGSRSVSAPGVASKILGQSSRPSTQNGPKVDLVEETRRRAHFRAQQEAEEAQRLLDDQDDDIPKLLASEIEPTSKLAEFVAHTDYVGTSPVESIPQQAESVYRDINSMVDTLGLNLRALHSFMLFQSESYHEDGRLRCDLEEEDSWVLEDLKALLSVVSKDLTQQLHDGKLKDFSIKLEECKGLEKDIHKSLAKRNDMQKLVASVRNESLNEIARSQPLSGEQTVVQHELRRRFTTFQTQLSQVEEALTTLKARIVSDMARSGRGNSGPSSDAIRRTIAKMTTMAEKRSGDIDVLEGQVRGLRLGSSIMGGSSIIGNGRESSPISTPQKNRSSVNFGTTSTSRFYTPDSIKDPRRSLRNSVMSNSGSPYGLSPRKKLSGYTAEEKSHLKSKLARRKEVMDGLRSALARSETRVCPFGDD